MTNLLRSSTITAAAVATMIACAPASTTEKRPGATPERNSADTVHARATAERLIARTAPDRPLRIIFDWDAREREGRFKGQGVARVEDPYHVRLDLFGPRGESYLTAAAVERNLRLPPNVDPKAVPPTPILWSVLGVFMPPSTNAPDAMRSDGERLYLEYSDSKGTWSFEFHTDILHSVEWNRNDGTRLTTELHDYVEQGIPRKVVYRDWTDFNEMTLKLEEAEDAEPFPENIWFPGRL